MDPRLLDAKADQYGTPRFFPPGGHPATFRMRQSLAKLIRFDAGDGASDAMVKYLRDRLAAFEERESVAKADYLRMLEGRR